MAAAKGSRTPRTLLGGAGSVARALLIDRSIVAGFCEESVKVRAICRRGVGRLRAEHTQRQERDGSHQDGTSGELVVAASLRLRESRPQTAVGLGARPPPSSFSPFIVNDGPRCRKPHRICSIQNATTRPRKACEAPTYDTLAWPRVSIGWFIGNPWHILRSLGRPDAGQASWRQLEPLGLPCTTPKVTI
jgi:hypothetical protein